jgi:hypothetical protein
MTVVAEGLSGKDGEKTVVSKRKQARPAIRGASLTAVVYLILAVVVIAAEQAGDDLGVRIASVVQAGKPKAALDRLEQ